MAKEQSMILSIAIHIILQQYFRMIKSSEHEMYHVVTAYCREYKE